MMELSGFFRTDSVLKVTHKTSFHMESMFRCDERAHSGCEYLSRLDEPVKASPCQQPTARRFRHDVDRSEKCRKKRQS